MTGYELEVGARTLDDVLAAERGGATRAELYSSPLEGALTPGGGLIRCASEAVTRMECWVMIRPRAGDFIYSAREFETMRRDVDLALELGAAGVMFGMLDTEGRLDRKRLGILACQCGRSPYALHRAFDFTPDPFEALEQAVDLGFRSLLTMGQDREATFPPGVRRAVVERAGERIAVQIALGADFDTAELPAVARVTGARHFHVVNGYRVRRSESRFPGRPDGGSDYLRETLLSVDYLCEEAVREVRGVLDRMEEEMTAC